MIVYDRLLEKRDPVGDFWEPGQPPVIRAVYDHTGVMSRLSAQPRPDGTHLILWGAPGFSIERVTDPRHHHISRLMDRPKDYADLIGTKKFVIEAPRNPEFMQARLPGWKSVGLVKDGIYRMEYALP